MKAFEAKEIAETFGNSLNNILRSVKILAEHGHKFYLVNKIDTHFSQQEIDALKELGYNIEINWSNDYAKITWI